MVGSRRKGLKTNAGIHYWARDWCRGDVRGIQVGLPKTVMPRKKSPMVRLTKDEIT
jgi:hypothetical protein